MCPMKSGGAVRRQRRGPRLPFDECVKEAASVEALENECGLVGRTRASSVISRPPKSLLKTEQGLRLHAFLRSNSIKRMKTVCQAVLTLRRRIQEGAKTFFIRG